MTPVVVGASDEKQIADFLEQVWGGDETLIVISSDLSHYHDYDSAQTKDKETSGQIEALNAGWIVPEHACGSRGECS